MSDDGLIDQMLDNMADPAERQARKVECPIDGCDYTGEPKSVSGHVSASSLDDHIWSNTRFDGWKHFNREMQSQVEDQVSQVTDDSQSSQSQNTDETSPSPSVSADEVAEAEVPCPISGCEITDSAPEVATHIAETTDGSHTWDETRFEDKDDFFSYIKTML